MKIANDEKFRKVIEEESNLLIEIDNQKHAIDLEQIGEINFDETIIEKLIRFGMNEVKLQNGMYKFMMHDR